MPKQSSDPSPSTPRGSLWSLAAITILLSNVADFLDAVRKVSNNLYNLLIFDWNGATYLPWILGIAGYALVAYLGYSTIRARRPHLRREAVLTAAAIPAIVLFGVNVFALPFGKHPSDVWKPALERLQSRLERAVATEGGFRTDPTDPKSERQAWTTAQVLVGLLMSPGGGERPALKSEAELVKHLDYLESMRRDDQGGWPYFPNRSWAVTEIGAWATMANVYALRSPLVTSDAVRSSLQDRIVRDLKDIVARQTAPGGGWKPIDDQKFAARVAACAVPGAIHAPGMPTQTPDLTRTYSTVMAVWALAEARAIPALRDEISRNYDGVLTQGITWLFANEFKEVGWTPNPSRRDTRESFAGLTAQTLFVLDRVARLDPGMIQQREAHKAAKQRFLRLKSLLADSISDNSRIPDSDLYLFPTDQVLEGSTFLWFPWSLATLTNLATDKEVSNDDRRLATRLRARLLALHGEELHYLEQAFTYELAETMIGVEFALRAVPAA